MSVVQCPWWNIILSGLRGSLEGAVTILDLIANYDPAAPHYLTGSGPPNQLPDAYRIPLATSITTLFFWRESGGVPIDQVSIASAGKPWIAAHRNLLNESLSKTERLIPFEGAVTVLDLIANTGPRAKEFITSQTPNEIVIP